MAEYTYVNILLPEAKRLADLYGTVIDLRACHNYCEKYLQIFFNITQPPYETQHLECFSTYIFVKYSRCFVGGVRKDFGAELRNTLSSEDLVLHDLVIDIRDKHIAHSVNDFESHKVRVWLNPEERGRKINNVHIESDYLAGPKPELFERLKYLIDKLLLWIEVEKKREEERLIQVVGQRYDLNDLYSLNAEVPDAIDYSRVKRRRRSP
jgi:hypothetical protein